LKSNKLHVVVALSRQGQKLGRERKGVGGNWKESDDLYGWSALFVFSSVWQSLSNLEVVKNTENRSSEKPNVASSDEFRISFIQRTLSQI
jgi:hypothetical protein